MWLRELVTDTLSVDVGGSIVGNNAEEEWEERGEKVGNWRVK